MRKSMGCHHDKQDMPGSSLSQALDFWSTTLNFHFGSSLCENSKIPAKMASCGIHKLSQGHLADYFRHLLLQMR